VTPVLRLRIPSERPSPVFDYLQADDGLVPCHSLILGYALVRKSCGSQRSPHVAPATQEQLQEKVVMVKPT
jgi:hypothetical protein